MKYTKKFIKFNSIRFQNLITYNKFNKIEFPISGFI